MNLILEPNKNEGWLPNGDFLNLSDGEKFFGPLNPDEIIRPGDIFAVMRDGRLDVQDAYKSRGFFVVQWVRDQCERFFDDPDEYGWFYREGYHAKRLTGESNFSIPLPLP